ncbi:MAG: hypothetical protein EOP04_09055 [Proteobacteria bacterium]|nr:MAG: hypothetical protein EOP04_09055 [Pseudomonadota bacterium]
MAKGKTTAVTWAQMVRDVLVAAINKGQLPVLGIFAVLLLIIYKLPETDVSSFARELFLAVADGRILWLGLWLGTTTAWIVHARIMRKQYSKEYQRIGNEKSNLQIAAAGREFKTSD